jgi:hypothetical protein
MDVDAMLSHLVVTVGVHAGMCRWLGNNDSGTFYGLAIRSRGRL